MKRSSFLLAALATILFASCGNPGPPRRDCILFIAGSMPANPGLLLQNLQARALTFEGPLRAPQSQLDVPSGIPLRVEMFTGVHYPASLDTVHERLPSLPEAARLSGRHALGFAIPGGINSAAGFDQFLPNEREGGLIQFESPNAFAPAITEGLTKINQRAQSRDAKRGPLMLIFDFANQADSGQSFESVLAQLDDLEIARNADIVVYFTDSDSSTRTLVAGPTVESKAMQRFVDPRDVYVTIARLARIPVPDILRGSDLVQLAQPIE